MPSTFVAGKLYVWAPPLFAFEHYAAGIGRVTSVVVPVVTEISIQEKIARGLTNIEHRYAALLGDLTYSHYEIIGHLTVEGTPILESPYSLTRVPVMYIGPPWDEDKYGPCKQHVCIFGDKLVGLEAHWIEELP